MLRRIGPMLIALAALIGLAWAQPAIHIDPSLNFDDSAFDYRLNEGYLHLRRDAVRNVLYVRLDSEPGPGGIAVIFADGGDLSPDLLPHDSWWYSQVPGRDRIGIVVTPRSVELPLDTDAMDTVAVLNAFSDALPSIGFVSEIQLVAGNSYIYRCGCNTFAHTHLQLSFVPQHGVLTVHIELQTPYAY
jgi:hypothetical protein